MAWRRGAEIKEIARERIEILLDLATRVFSKDRPLAKRYVELARRVGMKAGVRIPSWDKQFICRNCHTLLVPGVNCRVRTRSDRGTIVLVTCLECGAKKRYPTTRERLRKKGN